MQEFQALARHGDDEARERIRTAMLVAVDGTPKIASMIIASWQRPCQ
jgi:hypothetical protein